MHQAEPQLPSPKKLCKKQVLSIGLWTKRRQKDIPIYALREPEVPGTHIVEYFSDIDSIELKHTANSRDGFALGAIKAAEYIYDKKGIFTMKDVLGI